MRGTSSEVVPRRASGGGTVLYAVAGRAIYLHLGFIAYTSVIIYLLSLRVILSDSLSRY